MKTFKFLIFVIVVIAGAWVSQQTPQVQAKDMNQADVVTLVQTSGWNNFDLTTGGTEIAMPQNSSSEAIWNLNDAAAVSDTWNCMLVKKEMNRQKYVNFSNLTSKTSALVQWKRSSNVNDANIPMEATTDPVITVRRSNSSFSFNAASNKFAPEICNGATEWVVWDNSGISSSNYASDMTQTEASAKQNSNLQVNRT